MKELKNAYYESVNFIIIFSVVESEILDWKDILQKRLHKIYQKC